MADTIQQYRGKESEMPTLKIAQLGYCTDTKNLYVGTGVSNVLVGGEQVITQIAELITKTDNQATEITELKNTKLSASKAASQNE